MQKKLKNRLRFEILESRETPATLVNASTMTYQDVDGDKVTVTASKPVLTEANFTFDSAFATVGPQQLRTINLTTIGGAAAGVNITVAAVRSAANGGDGFAAVGQIDATGIDLGAIVIDGDLGRMLAGEVTTNPLGVASIKAQSMGRFGTSTGAVNLNTVIQGKLGVLAIKGDAKEAFIDVQGVDGEIGKITIHGSLLGGTAANSGGLKAAGKIGTVTIHRDVIGGVGSNSGKITAGGSLAGITIGGDLQGGTGNNSGRIISSGAIGAVKIAGNLIGVGLGSGSIFSSSTLAGLTIGGDLQGGAGNFSGQVLSGDAMGAVKIAGNVIGGGGSETGQVQSSSTLASVTIGGDLEGGAGSDSGRIESSGAMGAIKIAGNVIGGSGPGSGVVFTSKTLASVSIGGDLQGGVGSGSGQILSDDAMGPVNIKGDIIGGNGPNGGEIFTNSTLASATIGGDLRGGVGINSGQIRSVLAMGGVKIAGNVLGGDGGDSGLVFTNSTLASATIGGDLVGGVGNGSGRIESEGAMGPIKVLGNVIGGAGPDTGWIFTDSTMASVTIGGDLQGGAGDKSGQIDAGGAIGTIKITGNVIGGSASAGDLQKSGYIQGQRIGSLTIGGSLIAGIDTTAGTYFDNGAIRVANDIGHLTIGNIIGNAINPAIISARGQAAPTNTDLAFGKITVKGRVEFAQILAGIDLAGVGKNADAQIGPVTVGGDWIASSLVAGANATNAFFGDGDDAKIIDLLDDPQVVSKILSLTIGGQVLGTVNPADAFGIVAENVGIVKIGGTIQPTTANSDDFPIGITGDFRINEI